MVEEILWRHGPLLSPCTHLRSPRRRGVSSLLHLLRSRWASTAVVLVGLFPRGVTASNPLRDKVRRVNLGLSSLVARESSGRLLFPSCECAELTNLPLDRSRTDALH